jgi:hypothetical protein
MKPFLKLASVGKTKLGIYFDGSNSYSTRLGGVLTLIAVLVIFVYGCIVMSDVFKLKH